MRVSGVFQIPSTAAIGPILCLALAIPLVLVPLSRAEQSESPAPELGKIRSIAETQHEIVILLIRKKDYNQAASEAQKIFDMNWPSDQEPLLLRELLYLSDQFLHQEQPEIGLQLLNTNKKAFKTSSSQARIWKEKGYLFKKMNQEEKALECFREASRIEQSGAK
jgi:tetratricopeptide (TPR) repeat protein